MDNSHLKAGDIHGTTKGNEGYNIPQERPDDVKYEVAQSLGVPLREGDNGDLTTAKAGKVGGVIGGAMVKEMIRLAKQRLNNQQ